MATRPRHMPPNEVCLAQGAEFFCQIDRGGRGWTGRISDEHGIVRYRYRFQHVAQKRGWANPFNKPEFVVENADGEVELIIRRASFAPPVFSIIEVNNVVGWIRMSSPLRNRYAIHFGSQASWVFRMPLSTVQFHGESAIGTDVWVAVGPSQAEWSILVRPGMEDKRLVLVLAFIHNERWHYG